MSEFVLSRELLYRIPLFDRLNETERKQLAHAAQVLDFVAGEQIVDEGGDSQKLWIVLEGQVRVVKRVRGGVPDKQPIELAVLGPCQHFGEMSFFHRSPHSAAVVALTDVRLMCLSRAEFDELIEEGACAPFKLAYNALSSVAERLRRMDEWVSELVERDGSDKQVAEWESLRRKLFETGG